MKEKHPPLPQPSLVRSYADSCYAQLNKKVSQKSRLTYILRQQSMQSAIPVLMLIGECAIITAIGSKTGDTQPAVEENYSPLRAYDVHCLVKMPKVTTLLPS